MRIISGSARGRTIVAPQGMDTRPTQDYVRESLFNILRADVPGARVLDLFAGSGALGLEALSRGAEHAVFVDSARAAVACVRRNVETLRMDGRCQVLACDWRAAAQRLAGGGFDLVFIDPPYRMENTGAGACPTWTGGLRRCRPDAMGIRRSHSSVSARRRRHEHRAVSGQL